MGRLVFIAVAFALFACNKRTESAVKLSGLWEIESTHIELYENNEVVKDSVVDQQGNLALTVTGGLENQASTNLSYAPCWSNCNWEIPKKKKNQLFFSYYTEVPPYIQSTSVMIESHSGKKLVLVKIAYDGELNIQQKTTWEFKKAKL